MNLTNHPESSTGLVLFSLVEMKSSIFRLKKNTLLMVAMAFFALTALNLHAQTDSERAEIQRQLQQYPEVYLSIKAEDYTPALARLASMDYSDMERVYLYTNPEALSYIEEQGLEYKLEKSPGTVDFDLRMLDAEALLDKDLTKDWDFYPTYEAYVEMMYQFEEDFPDLVRIHNIGTTVMGRDMLFAQIGPDIGQERAVPRIMYTSTMHGDETTGFILSLRLIDHLLNQYSVDDDITGMMDQVEIWICPNENPDGTYTNNNSTVNGATRSNANGKDLNRNYPGPHPDYPNPPDLPHQPETLAMMALGDSIDFILSANMHGGIELVNFPWDSWLSSQQLHADHDWWEFVMHEYVDTVHAYATPGYMTGQGGGVTHGGDWYVAYGTRQDYFNYYHSCREFTLELSNQKLLNPDLLPAHWEYNHRSLINYIKQATYGFHGTVKDAQTGTPLEATVFLQGHDIMNSEVTTRMPLGNFNRPVLAGTYDVEFIADDYSSVTMNDLTINNYERLDLNIFMGDNVHPLYVYSSEAEAGEVMGAGIYPSGYEVVISALPREGYEFLYWENAQGDIVNEMMEFTYSMTGESTAFYAVFREIPTEFALHFTVGQGEGTLNARVDGNWVSSGFVADAGSEVEFVAAPATGYEVDTWKVNGTTLPDFNHLAYFVEDLETVLDVVVNFAPREFQLEVDLSDENAGSVTVNPDLETYPYGETITLNAIPGNGYSFLHWMDDEEEVLSEHTSYTFSMPGHDMQLTAVFEQPSNIAQTPDTSIRVFPNPARDQLSIEAGFAMERIELTDENGKVILLQTVQNSRSFFIPLNAVEPGFYLLKVQGAETRAVKKVQIF